MHYSNDLFRPNYDNYKIIGQKFRENSDSYLWNWLLDQEKFHVISDLLSCIGSYVFENLYCRIYLHLVLNVGISSKSLMAANLRGKEVISELDWLYPQKRIKMWHPMSTDIFWKSYLPMSYKELKQMLLPGKVRLAKKPSIFYPNMLSRHSIYTRTVRS